MKKIICILITALLLTCVSGCSNKTINSKPTILSEPTLDAPCVDVAQLTPTSVDDEWLNTFVETFNNEGWKNNHQLDAELVLHTKAVVPGNNQTILSGEVLTHVKSAGSDALPYSHCSLTMNMESNAVATNKNGHVIEKDSPGFSKDTYTYEFYVSENPIGTFFKLSDLDYWRFFSYQLTSTSMLALNEDFLENFHSLKKINAFENDEYYFWKTVDSVDLIMQDEIAGTTKEGEIIIAIAKNMSEIYVYALNAELDLDKGGSFAEIGNDPNATHLNTSVQFIFHMCKFNQINSNEVNVPQNIVDSVLS